MRQKYSVSRDGVKNKLNIREYAIIQKVIKSSTPSITGKETFSFLGGETYDSATIVSSIHEGLDNLVSTLRTHNLFPIAPHAIKIAELVIELYDTEEDRSVDLFFDDVDLFEKKPVLEESC